MHVAQIEERRLDQAAARGTLSRRHVRGAAPARQAVVPKRVVRDLALALARDDDLVPARIGALFFVHAQASARAIIASMSSSVVTLTTVVPMLTSKVYGLIRFALNAAR